MERAYNPQTGEYVFLVDNEWVKPTQKAVNPKTGESAFLVNNEWQVVPGQKPAAPTQAPATNVAGKPILAPAEPQAKPQAVAPRTTEEPPPYANRQQALDDAVNLLEEGAPKEQIIPAFEKMGIKWDEITKHGQDRGSEYFKQFTGNVPTAPRTKPPVGTMKGTEPGMLEGTANLFKRVDAGLSDTATSFLTQTGAIDPKAAGQLLARNAKQRAAAMPDSDTRRGMEAIGRSKTYGGAVMELAKNPAATFTMLAESVLTSLPAMAPAMVLGPAGALVRGVAAAGASGGMEYASVMTDVLQDKGVDMLDPNAITAALQNPDIIAEMKDKAAKRGLIVGAIDGLTMGIASKFLKPAQALIAEGKLAGSAAKKATISAWGKEFATQAAGGAGGEFLAQKATGENKPADVLLEALAEGVTAPLDVRSNLRESRMLEQAAAPQPATRIEPELDEAALLRGEVPKTVQAEEADEIEAITQDLIEQNIPADNARRIAVKRVAQARKERIRDLIAEKSSDEVDQRAKEYIDAGMDPVQAINKAREDIVNEREADALAQATAPGEKDVGPAITPAGGVSTPVVGQPSTVAAPEGAGAPVTDGMVPAGPDVTDVVEGKGEQPGALTQEEADAQRIAEEDKQNAEFDAKVAQAKKVAKTNFDTALDQVNDPMYGGNIDAALEAYEQNLSDTLDEMGEKDPDVLRKAGAEFSRLVDEYKKQQSEKATKEQPKGKRGRPKAALTPEEQQTKEATTKATNAANARERRAIERLDSALTDANLPVDETDIETPEALETAKAEKRAQKVQAVRALFDAAKKHGNSALGNKAKAILADRSRISQQEYDNLKAGWQATQASRQARVAASTANINTGVKGTMTAAEVLTQVMKTGTPFQKKLAGLLRKMVVGINVHVVEEGDPTPARLQGDENWERARGVYLRSDETGPREVYLRGASAGADNGVNNITILHELLHAALNRKVWGGLFGAELAPDAALTKFVNELNNLMVDVANSYNKGVADGTVSQRLMDLVESTAVFDPDTGETGFEIFELPHEFLSYGMTEPELQNFMRALPGKRNAFSRFVQSILKYIGLAESDSNALADLISVTEDISKAPIPEFRSAEEGEASYARKKKKAEKVEPPEEPIGTATVIPSNEDEFGNPIRSAKTLARDAQVAKEKVRASREGETLPAIEGMFKARKEGEVLNFLQGLVRNNWQGMTNSAIDKLVRLPTMTFLANWSGVKAIQDADIQMQRMVGMANSLTASAYEVRSMLAKELNPFFRSAKDFRTKFENLVYESTIARYDPSNPKNKVRNKHLDALWAQIGPKGRQMYKGLQKHYENLIDLYSDLLDQQIENLQGLAPEAKQNLMAMLRAKFETGARITPYFPLVRYGDYWLRVSKGDTKGFYMFESVGDRNAFRQQLADEMRESSDDSGIFESGDTVRSLRVRTQASSEMLKGVFEAIDKENFGAEDEAGAAVSKEALKDAVYQIYLNTMPEQSFRDMFIHRKDRTGFSTDVLRNVSASASKMSMQLARLKYAPMLRNSVSGAYDAVEGNSNLSPFAQETERRVNLALSGNPQDDLGGSIAGVANKLSYLWYLSSAASALIQPASVYITALPIIGANHGDMAGAAKELGKMVTLLNQYSVMKKHPDGTVSLSAPSLTNSESLSDLEKSAVREMFQRGVSQSTYTSLVWGYQNLPTRSASTVLGKAKELGKEAGNLAVGALMHNTERLTREATFLASYRLGFKQNMKRGMTKQDAHEAAINQAVVDVNESLANYDITNRPRYMQTGIGRVLLQFKMFPLHTALLLATNFFKMLPLLNKEGKAEAAKKFFGIYLTAGSIAGLAGIPAFSPIVGAIAYAFKHMQDEDDDLPDELKDKDAETWFRTVFLPDLLGDVTIGGKSLAEIADSGPLNAMTGLAISERIGLNDLFGRDTKEAKSSKEALSGWAIEKAGPSVSLGLSFADAYDAYQLGDFDKVAEKLSPAVLRNIILAERMAKDGIKDSKGNVIIPPDEAKGYAMAQAIGFRPAELARLGEQNFKLTAVEQRIVNERNTIMGRLKVQARKMNDEGAERIEKIVEKEVSRFNTKNPEYALMPDDIVDSLVKDLQTRASARLGFIVTEKNARLADPSLYRMEQRLEKLRTPK